MCAHFGGASDIVLLSVAIGTKNSAEELSRNTIHTNYIQLPILQVMRQYLRLGWLEANPTTSITFFNQKRCKSTQVPCKYCNFFVHSGWRCLEMVGVLGDRHFYAAPGWAQFLCGGHTLVGGRPKECARIRHANGIGVEHSLHVNWGFLTLHS